MSDPGSRASARIHAVSAYQLAAGGWWDVEDWPADESWDPWRWEAGLEGSYWDETLRECDEEAYLDHEQEET